MASWFESVPVAAPVEVFALAKAYREDSCTEKVDLSIGAYRDDDGKPWVLPIVRKVEAEVATDPNLNHEYLGILGAEEFTSAALAMLLGADSPAIKDKRATAIQTLSGTGALRLGADFLRKSLKLDTVYISSPSWPNHHLLFRDAGFTNIRTYRYWDPESKGIDVEGLMMDLGGAPTGSVVVLHACAHNPTGCDLDEEQWTRLSIVMREKKLFPFFDCAYQGFASGDLVKDSRWLRFFVSQGFELFCAQSFAKNFGLYNERVGNLAIVAKDEQHLAGIRSQMTLIARANYSNPPAHGSRIVERILSNKQYYDEWQSCIKLMSARIIKMRQELKRHLDRLRTPQSWDHITEQIGMFSYTGLTEAQVDYLVSKYHIYLSKTGRISMCGLNSHNIEYVAKAIDDAVRHVQ